MSNQSALKSICNFRFFLIKHLIVFLVSFFSISAFAQTINYDIRLNQIGYYPNLEKKAYAAGSISLTDFSIQSLDHATTYFTGTFSASRIADFSSFTIPGNYVLYVQGIGYSAPFKIHAEVFKDLSVAALKGYYYKRASTAITAEHGGVYARAAGHPDTQVMIHASAASPGRPAGTIVSSPKGWYDAGDYNCYVVNSNISTYTLLAAYEHFSSYYDTLNLNIPESGNGMPDILNEIKWNLDWMLTMQDPYDGRVYDKKTTASFSEFIMPEADQAQRYLVGKSTGATYGFAAVMAVAYRVYLPYDAAYANQCLEASKKAYASGASSLGGSSNPPDISTGVYNSQSNEGAWAGIELYISTKNDVYYVPNYQNICHFVPKWYQVNTVGLMSLVHHRKNLTAIGFADTTTIKNSLIGFANLNWMSSGFLPVFKYEWGDNSFALNEGMMDMCAYLITKDKAYLNAAIFLMDFVLGKNGSGYCYVTSFGNKKVMHPHDRISSADGIADPVPGWVVGGGSSYVDVEERYDLNEVAINWNAPLVFLTGAIQSVNRTDIKAVINVLNGPAAISSNQVPALLFGASIINTVADEEITITIKNSGTQPLEITSITTTSGFDVSALSSASPIASGASSTFTILATPKNLGVNTGTIAIQTNDNATPVFILNVSVKGKPLDQPFLQVYNGADLIASNNTPFVLLGAALRGEEANPITFTFVNEGTSPLVITSISVTSGFEINNNINTTVEADGSVSITIIPKPAEAGVNEGTITIQTNDPAHQTYILNIAVTGLVPLLSIEQGSDSYTSNGTPYIFTPVVQGQESLSSFIIKNSGTSRLTFQLTGVTGPFSWISQLPSYLDPGMSATFDLIFSPTATGTMTGTLSFASDADDTPFVLNLTGTGTFATATVGVLASDAISISPNPTKQDVAIQMKGSFNNVLVNVYNTLGIQVMSAEVRDISNESIPLRLTDVASGLYILEIITDQGSSMKRVVKE